VKKFVLGLSYQAMAYLNQFVLIALNSDYYLAMMSNNFMLELLAAGMSMHTQQFMQDRDRPHTANVVLGSLYVNFGDRTLFHHFPQCHECGHIWATRKPDISLCSCFLWGFLKEKLSLRKCSLLMQRRTLVKQLCHTILEDLHHKVIADLHLHLEEVLRENGDHPTHIVHHKQFSVVMYYCVCV
jgi:hypothetical protein